MMTVNVISVTEIDKPIVVMRPNTTWFAVPTDAPLPLKSINTAKLVKWLQVHTIDAFVSAVVLRVHPCVSHVKLVKL